MTSSNLVYAIDFGTSNSLLAAADEHRVIPPIALDPKASDLSVLKSILYTPAEGQWFYGAAAVEQYGEHLAEGRLFRSLKRYLPDSGFSGTTVNGKYYNLSELVAVFLRELRARANAHFQQDVTSVVLGRPVAFALDGESDELAEKRLRAAAQIAGFKDISFCPEPVAAAYEFRHQLTEEKTVLIADFGGGTSDYTVLRMGRERFTDKDVLAIGGIPIAGDRFDGSIMKHMIAPHFGTDVTYRMPMGSNDLSLPTHLVNKLCAPADVSFLSRKDILSLLKDAQKWALDDQDKKKMDRLFVLVEEHLGYKLFKSIEDAKIRLSGAPSARFHFDYPGIEVEEELHSADFRAFSAELVDKITASLDDTLRRAGVKAEAIDIVCCTGGTARLPALAHELGRRFGKDKLVQHRHFHSVIGGLADKAQAMITS